MAKNKKPKFKKTDKNKRRKSKKRVTQTTLKRTRTAYVLNPGFEFFNELRDLILKSSPTEKGNIIKRVNKLGYIKLVIIAGIFTDPRYQDSGTKTSKESGDPLGTDLLIVGDNIDRRKLRILLRALEADAGKEIRFAVMDKEEFQYRLNMFDRFVRVLLDGPHEKLINKLGI